MKTSISEIFNNRLLKTAALLSIAMYVGKYLGEAVLARQHMIVIAIFVGSAFLLLSSAKHKFYLLSLSVFVPFMFQRFLVRNLLWLELLAPLFCFLMMLDLIMNRKNMFSKEAKLYYIAIGILFVWSVINFARNPVLGGFFGGAIGDSGLRAYLAIFVGITLFFYSVWYFRDRNINSSSWLSFIILFSLIIGYLRLAGYFAGFRIPFLGGVFGFQAGAGLFHRIGGLSEMAVLGIAAVLSLYNNKKWNLYHMLLFILFFVLLVFSGGRGAFMGVALMFIVYIIFINRRYFFPIMLLIVIAASSFVIFFQGVELPAQIQRVTAVEGGIEKQDKFRTKSYELLLDYFMENPIFGKGIGISGSISIGGNNLNIIDMEKEEDEEKKGSTNEDEVTATKKRKAIKEEDFAATQAAKGGHGSYVSMLSLFGIGGLVYFLIMLYGSIYYSYKIHKRKLEENPDSKLVLFAFLYLVAQTLIYIPGGAGYDNMDLWFLAGMVAGIKSKNGV